MSSSDHTSRAKPRATAYVTGLLALVSASLAFACTSDSPTRSQVAFGRPAASASGRPLDLPRDRALQVRSSARITPGVYLRPPRGVDLEGGVIVLDRVRGAVLDLSGVALRGTFEGTDPDANEGIGIVLRGCEDVTIKGGRLGGYRGCIVATDCVRLVIEDVEFDGWYASRLASTPLAEDETDWLYPHENDDGEWLADYGGAISLTDCREATIRNCRGRHGQNGILLTRCERAQVYDNDFSFLSGWGLALYRSSHNVVCRNAFDYCVRGYSHGVYWRGQDSAGILMFERCSDNLVALNSATHGGDGLFLFAGRDTVDGLAFERGELDAGGADRNIFFQNDFSYAVANAIETTFSRDNWAIENELSGSHQHGLWGGYSSRMVILGNTIDRTLGGGVSIEHGQDCAIADNTFEGNDIGVELWWDEDPDLVGGPFGTHRDTSSRDHWIEGNAFADNAQDLVLKKTSGVTVLGNSYAPSTQEVYVDKLAIVGAPPKKPEKNTAADTPDVPDNVRDWLVAPDGSRPSGHLSESSLDVARKDAPDFLEKARAWQPPPLPGRDDPCAAGRNERRGLDTIVIGEWGPWDFRSGEPRPKQRAPGGLLAGSRWQACWFSWQDGADPRGDVEAWRALQSAPLAREKVRVWTDPWGGIGAVRKKVGSERFGLIASAEFSIGVGGVHRLSVVSDDGVRVAIDGVTALENWTWHAPVRDVRELELAPGVHRIEVEYFQIDGASALSIELELQSEG